MGNGGSRGPGGGRRRIRLAGVAASVAAVLVAVVLAITGGSSGGEVDAVGAQPHFVDVGELIDAEGTLGHRIYWAGERPPNRLELKQEGDGSVYLRYLPPGTSAGDPGVTFLTVGSYPVADAQGALRRAATAAGTSVEQVNGGAVVLPNPASEGSVYLAYPDSDLEIEVYDPLPGRALELIRSGAIRPVGQG